MSLYASGVVRIISEPQLKSFDSGNVVVNFAGGINEGKDKDGFYINNAIDVEIWGKNAEIVFDTLRKVIAYLSPVMSAVMNGKIRTAATSAASIHYRLHGLNFCRVPSLRSLLSNGSSSCIY